MNIENPLAISNERKQSPYALISLWDMIDKFMLQQFTMDWELLCATSKHYDPWGSSHPGIYPKTEDQKNLMRAIGGALRHCRGLELPVSLDRAERFFASAQRGNVTYSTIKNELKNLIDSMKAELSDQMLLFIPSEKSEFYDNAGPFADVIGKKFPESEREIKWARTCMAMELYTAAVYHLTRAAEVVLMDVARRCNIQKTLSGEDINAACWGPVIAAIHKYLEEEITRLGKTRPRTKAKVNRLKLFQSTNRHLKEIKDLWRDPASHGIDVYTATKADEAYRNIEQLLVDYSTNRTRKF